MGLWTLVFKIHGPFLSSMAHCITMMGWAGRKYIWVFSLSLNSEATTVEKTKHLSPLGEKQSLHYYAVSRAPIGKWSPHQKKLVAPPPPPPPPKKRI